MKDGHSLKWYQDRVRKLEVDSINKSAVIRILTSKLKKVRDDLGYFIDHPWSQGMTKKFRSNGLQKFAGRSKK